MRIYELCVSSCLKCCFYFCLAFSTCRRGRESGRVGVGAWGTARLHVCHILLTCLCVAFKGH